MSSCWLLFWNNYNDARNNECKKKKNPQQIGVVNQTEECLQVATTLVHSFILQYYERQVHSFFLLHSSKNSKPSFNKGQIWTTITQNLELLETLTNISQQLQTSSSEQNSHSLLPHCINLSRLTFIIIIIIINHFYAGYLQLQTCSYPFLRYTHSVAAVLQLQFLSVTCNAASHSSSEASPSCFVWSIHVA